MVVKSGRVFLWCLGLWGVIACGAPHREDSSRPAFDGAHALALDGVIEEGRAIVSRESEARSEIGQQLSYAIGQLNGLNAGPDLQRVSLQIRALTPRHDGRLDARYRAAFIVAWPREESAPRELTLVLPEGGDVETLKNFFARYGDRHHGCAATELGEELGPVQFWYYYRPSAETCPLRELGRSSPLAVELPLRLTHSKINTSGKFPEYGKVWEDGKLVVTAVFGKDHATSHSGVDPGVASAEEFARWLRRNFGAPVRSNLPPGARFGRSHPSLEATYATPSGPLVVHLELVESIALVDEAFERRYGDAVSESDLVTYSGHSDLGANIRSLVRMGRIVPDQYRIFLINSCDSFSYVDDVLRDAHLAANPGKGPHKYFDLITNAMPSYFMYNARSNSAVILALLGRQKTYRQILADFDESQRPVVTGEEDNLWPQAF